MNKNLDMKKKNKKNMKKNILILITVLLFSYIILYFFPDKKGAVVDTSYDFFIEMITILPAVVILMGLFKVWVPNEMVIKYLGKSSGIKGILISILMGSFPTGPLYIAFPIAKELINKGAKISNIIIFLSAWACIKIPQELVELQFLGFEFMITRLILTIIFVIIMGYAIEKIYAWSNSNNKESLPKENEIGRNFVK